MSKIPASEIIVRQAVLDDTEWIVAMHRDTLIHMYPGVSVQDMERRYTAFGSTQDRLRKLRHGISSIGIEHCIYVAQANGSICGFTQPTANVDGLARVGALYVAKEYLRRGIGTALLQENLAWHRTNDASEVYIEIHPETASFYEKFGFTATGDAVDDAHARRLRVVERRDIVMRLVL